MAIFDPFEIHPRPPHHLSHGGLDRDDHGRSEKNLLREYIKEPGTKFVPLWKTQNFFALSETPQSKMKTLDVRSIEPFISEKTAIYLGKDQFGLAFFAVDISNHNDDDIEPLARYGKFGDLRSADPSISGFDSSIMGYAKAMCYWHSRAKYCPDCGSETEPQRSGHTRVCTDNSCKTTHFPRTDAAVIVAVTRENKILLGRQPIWPDGMLSVLAGFVEPGETLEHAVAREVYEEVGLVIKDVQYQQSQPWPFPASLMLGFRAEAVTEGISINTQEIEHADWYSREEINQFANTKFYLPRKLSISRLLIDNWINESQR